MRIFKKTLALLLAAVTILSCCPTAVFAHTFTDVTEYDDAIELLSDLEVIKGYSTTSFGPKDNITRWQMALLISKIMSGDTRTETWWKETGANSKFTDVLSAHYLGSIIYAAEQGVILGRGDGIFDPATGITVQEGITMAIRALNLDTSTMDAGWPESYIIKANDLDLLDGVKFSSYTQTMTRGQTAQLLYNMLFTERSNGKTFAATSFDIGEEEQANVVVVATKSIRLDNSLAYARSGYVTVKALQNDGTLGKSYSVQASALGISNTDSAIGLVYTVNIDSDGDITSGTAAKSTTVTTGLTVNGTQNTITFGGTTYKTVTDYSYTLKEGTTPSSKEIIVYGFNSLFKTPGIIKASNMVNTNAYFSLVTYDVNNDGYADRAVYTPYMFDQYTAAEYKDVTVNGATLKEGDYFIGSYSSQTESLFVYKALTLTEGVANSNTATTITIGGVTYTYGNDNLPGADNKTVAKGLSTKTDAYKLSKVSYVADGNTLLYIKADATTQYTGSYVSRTTCAVVTADAELNNGIVTVKLNINNSNQTIQVSKINGALAASYYTSLKTGDIVEYTLDAAANAYTVNEITSTPSLVTTVATPITYDNAYIVLGGTDKVPVLSSTVVYWFDNTTSLTPSLTLYNATSSNFIGKTIPANYSIYVAYGFEGVNYATFMYIRPTDATVGNVTPGGTGSILNTALAVVAEAPTYNSINGTVKVKVYLENSTTPIELNVSTINNQTAASAYSTLAVGTPVTYSMISTSGYALTTVSSAAAVTGNTNSVMTYANGNLVFTSNTGTQSTIPVTTNTVVITYNGVSFSAKKVTTNMAATILPASSSIYVTYGNTTSTVATLVYVRSGAGAGSTATTVTGNLNANTTAIVRTVTPVTSAGTSYVIVNVCLPNGMPSYDLKVTKINGAIAALSYTLLAPGDIVTFAADSANSGYYTVTKIANPTTRTFTDGTISLSGTNVVFKNSLGVQASIAVDASTLVLISTGGEPVWNSISTLSLTHTAAQDIYVASANNVATFIYIKPAVAGSTPVTPSNPSTPTVPSGTGTYAIVTGSDATHVASGFIVVNIRDFKGESDSIVVSKINNVSITSSSNISLPQGTLINYSTISTNNNSITTIGASYTAGSGYLSYNNQKGGLCFTDSNNTQRKINVTLGSTKIYIYDSSQTISFRVEVVFEPTNIQLGSGQKIYIVDSNTIYIK